MEKNWIVECWGDTGETALFYTRKEAEAYFKGIRKSLDKTKYIFTKDTITNKDNANDVIIITNLKDL